MHQEDLPICPSPMKPHVVRLAAEQARLRFEVNPDMDRPDTDRPDKTRRCSKTFCMIATMFRLHSRAELCSSSSTQYAARSTCAYYSKPDPTKNCRTVRQHLHTINSNNRQRIVRADQSRADQISDMESQDGSKK